MKYTVTLTYHVEAETRDEALQAGLEAAFEIDDKGLNDSDIRVETHETEKEDHCGND
ncbi:hypothetical protein [Desulfovibrio oxyclinae]|uniref:hypothetical protein n=1 Tax=Desulfovibrio oxyclinae TaxID=63560 RepID=UPI00037DDA61|nr:hypothetical protein [Desulfovibrio oxyclinae]